MRYMSFGAATVVLLLLSACASGGTPVQDKERATSEPTASTTIVRIAVSDVPYPPFAFKEASGRWTGFDVELSRAVCEVEQLTCDVVAVPWEDLIFALVERRVDAIWASMQTTDARREVIEFTNLYYESIHALIGPASSVAVPNIENPDSLKGKTIGVQTATVSAAYMQQHLAGIADVRRYDTLDGALVHLKAGRLDYVSEFVTFLAPFLKENPAFVVKAISPLNPILNQGIAVGVRQDDAALDESKRRYHGRDQQRHV